MHLLMYSAKVLHAAYHHEVATDKTILHSYCLYHEPLSIMNHN